ncbi:hypothetical protein HYW82_03885 [Candidatus Peregrinibacteria bacterium]|nr:hypothetical protein [Candidatus Peregrinibacteria bacterium]
MIIMGKRNGSSEHTYVEIIRKLDPPCKDTINKPTDIDAAIVTLREAFLNRVSKNQRMRLPLDRCNRPGYSYKTDILGDGNPVVESWALPFGHRQVPKVHIDWLRKEIKTRGLSQIVSIEE